MNVESALVELEFVEDSASSEWVHVLWAPDTPQSVVDEHEASFAAAGDPNAGLFDDSNRWTRTATDGNGLSQGDPTNITWSIVPDGTAISGYNGEPSAPSDLRARLDTIYGSQSVWLPLFEQVFDRWSEVSGVNYVYESSDDGASLSSFNRGVLDVRGDVRIGGHYIDGNSGTLAYNFYPNSGDMVIDTGDSYFNNTSNNSRGLRNTLAHEAGHGLGLQHTLPTNRTKLMEPYLTTSFDGPQFNDILSVQRGYGDALEGNDTVNTATFLGTLLNEAVSVDNVSIDDNSDVDYFSFTITTSATVDITLSPFGPTYSLGEQGGGTTNFNASTQSNLALRLIGPDGSTVIMDVNDSSYGEDELLSAVLLDDAGTYFVRVTGDTNFAQMYELDIAVAEPVAPNVAPVAVDDVYSLAEGETLVVSLTQGVLLNDIDSNGDPMSVSLISGPAYADAFNLNADGSFDYTPAPGFSGSDSFTYSVSDNSGAQDVGVVTLTVLAAPDPPAVLEMIINGGEAQRSTVTVLAFVFDQDVVISADALQVLNLDTSMLLDTQMIHLHYDSQSFTATFTFEGLMGASLDDGNHEIRLVSQAISSATGVEGLAAPTEGQQGAVETSESDFVVQVHRLFGDVDGDRDVDAADLFDFRGAYQTQAAQAAFDAAVDYDRDGDVDAADLFQFRERYQSHLAPVIAPIAAPTATPVAVPMASTAVASPVGDAIQSQAFASLALASFMRSVDARRAMNIEPVDSPWKDVEPLAQLWLAAFADE